MNAVFNVTAWLEAQVGCSPVDVKAEAKEKIAETRWALVQAQRGQVSLQKRAAVSAISKVDSRLRNFLIFAQQLNKRPAGVTAVDWGLYRAIVAAWVDSGQVKPEALQLFGDWGAKRCP